MKELYNEILNTFENEDIKEFTKQVIDRFDPYVFEIPASSTGKYHPEYSLGRAGLLRHTIGVVRFLNYFFGVESICNQFTSRERDLLRCAAIAHDCKKSGSQEEYENSKFTKFNHPLLAAKFIRSMDGLPKYEIERIALAIESHMGQWNVDKHNPDVVLPKPSDKYQIILHLADYLASRKDITLKFSEEYFPLPDINEWKFTWGKHNGMTIPEIAVEDPGYIVWAKANMDKEPAKSLLKNFEL